MNYLLPVCVLFWVSLLSSCGSPRPRPRSQPSRADASFVRPDASDGGVDAADAALPDAEDAAISDASSDPCEGVDCSGHGQCAIIQSTPRCFCDPGYHDEGLTCVVDPNNAPRVRSLSANPSSLTQGQMIVFTAEVEDMDGLQDVVGGQLLAPTGEPYGTFLATGPGTYSITIDWEAIHAVRSIEFTLEEQRTFVADFFDAAGNHGTGNAIVRLHCDQVPAPAGACASGVCITTDTDDFCGGCNLSCVDNAGYVQDCVQPGLCQSVENPAGASPSCSVVCSMAAPQGTCLNGRVHRRIEGIFDVDCGFVASSSGWLLNLPIDWIGCECNLNESIARRPSSDCAETCAYYGRPTCRNTQIGFTHPSSLNDYVAEDNCAAPYQMVDWDAQSAGSVVPVEERDLDHWCYCEYPSH